MAEDGSDDEFLDSEDAYGEEVVDDDVDDELETGWNEDGPLRLIIEPTKIRKAHNLLSKKSLRRLKSGHDERKITTGPIVLVILK